MRKVVSGVVLEGFLVVVRDDGAVFRLERKGWVEMEELPETQRAAERQFREWCAVQRVAV